MDKFPGTKRREHFASDKEAFIGAMTQAQLKAVETLAKTFKDSTPQFRSNGAPYIRISIPDEEMLAETEQMLQMLGIFPWVDDTTLEIEHPIEVYKMQLIGVVNDPLNELGLEDWFPMHYKSIPQIFDRKDQNTGPTLSAVEPEDDMSSDARRIDRGEILADEEEPQKGKIEHGDISYLNRKSRDFFWKGSKLFSRKEKREISTEEYNQVLKMAQEGDAAAREQFLKMNMSLVYFVVLNFSQHKPHTNQADLLQEGVIEMNAAIDRYKWDMGAKFSTYAAVSIEGVLHHFHRDNKGDVRIPRRNFDKTNEINRVTDVEHTLGESELQKRVAARLGISIATLVRAKELYAADREYVDVRQESDRIEDKNENERALKEYFENESTEIIKSNLEDLSPRERLVLVLRFGLGPEILSEETLEKVTETLGSRMYDPEYKKKGFTLDTVAEYFDVSRERIRQIEMKALRKLRHSDRSKRLLPLLLDLDTDE